MKLVKLNYPTAWFAHQEPGSNVIRLALLHMADISVTGQVLRCVECGSPKPGYEPLCVVCGEMKDVG